MLKELFEHDYVKASAHVVVFTTVAELSEWKKKLTECDSEHRSLGLTCCKVQYFMFTVCSFIMNWISPFLQAMIYTSDADPDDSDALDAGAVLLFSRSEKEKVHGPAMTTWAPPGKHYNVFRAMPQLP